MLEAVVGVALRAILASVLLGGVLAAIVMVATRALALTAATRHALWTMALIATAVMPLAGVGVSIWKATAPQLVAEHAARTTADHVATVSANGGMPHRSLAAPAHNAAGTSPANDGNASALRPVTAPASADRFAFARWTPRMSRNLAIGIVGIWALGALAGLIGLAGSIVRVRGLKRRSSPLDGALADELPWLTEVGPGREIYLRLSYETETPVAIGFRRPVILIPTELATADGLVAIEPLILHEHAHLRRRDDWTNLVQRAIERIFWFNPIVWLVGRRIALEREIASDDAVVEKTGEAHAYATSLWKLAREMRMPEHAVVAPGALLTRKQIAVRIEQLLDKKRARLHRSPAAALGVVLASALAVAFVATSAPAVELPATTADSPAPPPTAWHADGAHRAITEHARAATAAKPAGAKDALAVLKVGAKPLAAVNRAAAGSAASLEITAKRIAMATGSAVKHVPASSPVRDRLVTVYVHESSAPGIARDAEVPPVAPVPPVPNVPAVVVPPVVLPPVNVPPIAPVRAMPVIKAQTLRAIQLAKINDAKSRAAFAQAHVELKNLGTMGPEISRVMKEAMASIPRELAASDEEGAGSGTQRPRLDGVKLSRELIASCTGCSFRNADIRGVDLHGLRISANNFAGADMRGANLSGAKLTGVSLRGANLANADLRNAELAGVELRGAIFDGVQFEGIKLVGVSFQGVSLRGAALRSVVANCTGCDFSHMDLHGQDLHGIALSGASFARADLHDANLSGVRFSGVELSHANLTGVDFTNAHLDGCSLGGADLHGARLTGMTMTGSSGLDG